MLINKLITQFTCILMKFKLYLFVYLLIIYLFYSMTLKYLSHYNKSSERILMISMINWEYNMLYIFLIFRLHPRYLHHIYMCILKINMILQIIYLNMG